MTDQPSRICVTRAHPANDGVIDLTDITNEISIEIDGKTITGSYEVNRGMIMVSGGILGKKSTPLGGPRNFWPVGCCESCTPSHGGLK